MGPSNIRLDARPLYIRVEEALVALLENYVPNEQLPPEAELAVQLGISRATLREALRGLEERGLITRRHGVGTFVSFAPPMIKTGLEVLESVDTMARRIGLECGTGNLQITEEPADAALALHLDVDIGIPVVLVDRVRVVGGRVVAYMVDAVPAAVSSAEQMRAGFTGSVLDRLVELGADVAYANTKIRPILAAPDLAHLLEVPPKTQVLLLEEVVYNTTNRPIDYSLNYYLTDHLEFHVIRRLSSQEASWNARA